MLLHVSLAYKLLVLRSKAEVKVVGFSERDRVPAIGWCVPRTGFDLAKDKGRMTSWYDTAPYIRQVFHLRTPARQ